LHQPGLISFGRGLSPLDFVVDDGTDGGHVVEELWVLEEVAVGAEADLVLVVLEVAVDCL
jgi:hypothetical protein